ncbi:MAG: vitamin K epoxide reductase family protein [Actinomycetota bacterium]
MNVSRTRLAGLGFALVALGASAYLTYAHYTSPDVLVCSDAGRVNCEAVTTSSWSQVAGVPVSLLGLLWAIAMVALFLPAADRWPRSAGLRRLGALAGAISVLWLVYVEFVLVGAICVWCTVVHVATLGMFAITSAGLDGPRDQPA